MYGVVSIVSHMKTTIEIADGLLLEAKERAARDGTTLRALVEEGLRAVLGARRHGVFSLRDASVDGRGLSEEYRGVGWERIREAVYEERGG
jgi:hypothetical protein